MGSPRARCRLTRRRTKPLTGWFRVLPLGIAGSFRSRACSCQTFYYLREAIENRGGLAKVRSEQEIREAVIEGAVPRLRSKLLTEGTMALALIPMLWSTGVGSEFMKPRGAPILGGILVADEVIEILIPVLFFWEQCSRYPKLRGEGRTAGEQVPPGLPLTEP